MSDRSAIECVYASYLNRLADMAVGHGAVLLHASVSCAPEDLGRDERPPHSASRNAVNAVLASAGLSIDGITITMQTGAHGAPLVDLRPTAPLGPAKPRVLLSKAGEGGLSIALAGLSGKALRPIRGVGVDYISGALGRSLLEETQDEVLACMFYPAELREATRLPDGRERISHLLATVAIKEAAFKAVGGAFVNGERREHPRPGGFMDLEIHHALTPQQRVVPHNGMRDLIEASGVNQLLSLGFAADTFVGALALAL